MRKSTIAATLIVGLVITLGCGKKDDGTSNINPAPGVTNPNGIIGNCANIGGGTALSNLPFTGTLVSQNGYTNQSYNRLSSITLNPYFTNSNYVSASNNIIASGQITLADLAYLYTNGNTNGPSACISSAGGAQSNTNSGYFSNGQVRSLALNGSIQVPLVSPFSWGGNYQYGSPGTSPTLGQQMIQVIVGSLCNAAFVPSYGNNQGRIRGCVSVRLGTQVNSQTLNYQSQ